MVQLPLSGDGAGLGSLAERRCRIFGDRYATLTRDRDWKDSSFIPKAALPELRGAAPRAPAAPGAALRPRAGAAGGEERPAPAEERAEPRAGGASLLQGVRERVRQRAERRRIADALSGGAEGRSRRRLLAQLPALGDALRSYIAQHRSRSAVPLRDICREMAATCISAGRGGLARDAFGAALADASNGIRTIVSMAPEWLSIDAIGEGAAAPAYLRFDRKADYGRVRARLRAAIKEDRAAPPARAQAPAAAPPETPATGRPAVPRTVGPPVKMAAPPRSALPVP